MAKDLYLLIFFRKNKIRIKGEREERADEFHDRCMQIDGHKSIKKKKSPPPSFPYPRPREPIFVFPPPKKLPFPTPTVQKVPPPPQPAGINKKEVKKQTKKNIAAQKL